MNRNRLFTIVLVLLTLLTSCTAFTRKEPKVLIILEEKSTELHFTLKNEVGVMAQMLEQAGYKVVYASKSGVQLGYGDVTLQPDLKLEDVNVNDYVGIVLPCLAIGVDRPFNPDIDRIVAEAASAGKPIAAASGAIISLQSAGVLVGKQFAANQVEGRFIYVGKNIGDEVSQDGNIITSAYCPFAESIGMGKDQTTELTQKFIEALKSAT